MLDGGRTGSISETGAQQASSSWEDQVHREDITLIPGGLHGNFRAHPSSWGGGHSAASPLQPPSNLPLHSTPCGPPSAQSVGSLLYLQDERDPGCGLWWWAARTSPLPLIPTSVHLSWSFESPKGAQPRAKSPTSSTLVLVTPATWGYPHISKTPTPPWKHILHSFSQ